MAVRTCRRLPLVVLALVVSFAALAHTQDEAGDGGRLIEALSIVPGMAIAEIGAGDGALTIALARRVGAEGLVLTTELGDERLKALQGAIERAKLSQVRVVAAATDGTNLDAGCCDVVVMRDVYHHFDDPAVMNASLLETLRPGGRLAILDFEPRDGEKRKAGARAIGNQHGIARDVVVSELTAAGFSRVSVRSIAGRRFMVVAQRPDGSM
jgi:ubiquinone/menaquinone biosynthesis C-methylase UbiE